MNFRVWAGILSTAFIAAGCSDDAKPSSGNGVSCGPGTVQRDGVCILEGRGGLECGDGTVKEDGVCVPEEIQTGLECGEGTIEEDGECVPDGADPVCGNGTILEDGECVPDGSELCEPGTIFDSASGHCELDPTSCADGTVFLAGQCVPEDSTLQADLEESAEPNDDDSAGAFDAPALGAATTVHGCVTPENGESDIDAWLVDADGPMVLEITRGRRGRARRRLRHGRQRGPPGLPTFRAKPHWRHRASPGVSARGWYLPVNHYELAHAGPRRSRGRTGELLLRDHRARPDSRQHDARLTGRYRD